jgi:hypothetical protein
VDTAKAIHALIEDVVGSMHKTGVVTALSGNQVVVSIDGGSITLPRLASYTPAVDDVVQILALRRGSWLVLGKTA